MSKVLSIIYSSFFFKECSLGCLCFSGSLPIFQIGTGFKDDQLDQHAAFFKEHLLDGPKPYYRYNEGTQPDQWFDSVQVM